MVREVSWLSDSCFPLLVQLLGGVLPRLGASASWLSVKVWARVTSSETKVANFHIAIGVDQQVCRLDVAVQDVGSMHEVHGTEEVVQQLEQVILCELNLRHRLENLLDVCLHELQHEENVGQIVQVLWSDDIKDFGRKLVTWHLGELAEDLNFSDDLLTVILILEDVVDEFNGHNSTGLSLFGLDNFTVAADTNELNELVIVVGVPPDR